MIFVNTAYKRFLLATTLWVVFWPIFWRIQVSEITGPTAWLWIVGQLSYPLVAIVYVLLDSVLTHLKMKTWVIFTGAVLVIILVMPFYYERYGFALGVSLEARFL
jgi:hypothetical protein